MPAASSTPPTDLALTPEGRLSGPTACADDADTLFGLASGSGEAQGPAADFFRSCALGWMARLCHLPPEPGGLPRVWSPAAEELESLVAKAPPMTGGEYLDARTLAALWHAFQGKLRGLMSAHPEGAYACLHAINPALNAVGRVTFHLAENPASPDRPFAFMATFVEALSADGKPRHLPLGRALKAYAEAGDNDGLLRLLTPVSKAGETSPLVKRLADSREIFTPRAWTPAEAFSFLREVPAMEGAGLTVRIPDWWSGRHRTRAAVKVTVGSGVAGGVSLGEMLDFDFGVVVGEDALTAEETRALLASGDGLVLFKGKWTVVDRGRLEAALAHWESVRREAPDGLTLMRSMRLLAGIAPDKLENITDADPDTGTVQSVAGARLKGILDRLRDASPGVADAPVAGLKATLRPYQEEGVRRLHFLQHLGLGACLADDMGLGKTVQVLALLRRIFNEDTGLPDRRPALLIAPTSLLHNWRSEAAKFTPSLRLRFAHPAFATPGAPDPVAEPKPCDLAGIDLVVTTYGMAGRLGWLRSHEWRLLVLDEAQAIKTPGAAQTKAVKAIRARARLALTGTPVENRLSDLWSLFDFTNPGLLGTGAQFTRYTKELSDYAPLRRLVAPYILRRMKTDKRIISDLPDKIEMAAVCTLTARQAALYKSLVDDMKAMLEAAAQSGENGAPRRGLVLAALMRFKQLCNHPDQLAESAEFDPAHSGKFKRLGEIAAEIASRGEKLIVFTQFREMTAPLEKYLSRIFGAPGLVLHGGTPVPARRALVERFQDPHGPAFFVLTVKAGGTGLTLTAANHVVHFDRWWNPAVENQATDRAFRIGQKKTVTVHKLICRGTVEEKIDALIERKKALSAELLASGCEPALTELSDKELLDLVSLDLSSVTVDD
jgi:superfamily II DNA or RNA helicase